MTAKREDRLEYELRGKTWRVYWHLLRHDQPVSAREVHRALGFSSPSVAQHHLERLCDLGLVHKNKDGYVLTSEVKIGVLRHFIKLGRLLFPRYLFYAVFSTVFYIIYLSFLLETLSRENLFVILFGAIVVVIFWYETIRVWRLKPY